MTDKSKYDSKIGTPHLFDPAPGNITQNAVYLEGEVSVLEVLGKDVQHADHLWEDEDAVSSLLQPHQQLVQQDQFATRLDQCLRVDSHVTK